MLLLLAAIVSVAWQLGRVRCKKDRSLAAFDENREAMRAGLQRVLPLTLLVTFLVVPATATLVFKTFLCDEIEYDDVTTRQYLHDNLAMSCDSVEYEGVRNIAIIAILVWPVGGGHGARPRGLSFCLQVISVG